MAETGDQLPVHRISQPELWRVLLRVDPDAHRPRRIVPRASRRWRRRTAAVHQRLHETDPAAFAADLPPFAQALAAIHALDWRAVGLDLLGVPESPSAGFAREIEFVEQYLALQHLRYGELLQWSTDVQPGTAT
jgi:hypothetical protein